MKKMIGCFTEQHVYTQSSIFHVGGQRRHYDFISIP